MVRVLIVDDEPLARERLSHLLKSQSGFQIVGTSRNGSEAVKDVLKLRPDLMFLDVEMPGMNGFEVMATLQGSHIPAVVFVTAFDQYAMAAFDVHAIDYLLKPYSEDRFESALKKAVREVSRRRKQPVDSSLDELLGSLRSDGRVEERILIRTPTRVSIVKVADIDWVESAGNYVKLHAGKEVHMQRETMKAMEQRLGQGEFARIHRSTIVRVSRVEELKPLASGDYELRMKDGTKLALSRRYRDALKSHFQL